MREYILTAQERKIILHYLDTNEKLENFKAILYRCRHMTTISQDYQLVQKFLRKANSKPQSERQPKTQISAIPISNGKIKSFIETLPNKTKTKTTHKPQRRTTARP